MKMLRVIFSRISEPFLIFQFLKEKDDEKDH